MAGGSGYATGESLYDTWVRNNSLYPSGGIAISSPSLISASVQKTDLTNTDTGIFKLKHLAGRQPAPGLIFADISSQDPIIEGSNFALSFGHTQGPLIPVNDWRVNRAQFGFDQFVTSSVQISREDPSKLIWKWAADIPAFVPWTQLRQGDLHPLSRKRLGASFMNRTQILRLENQAGDPQAPVVEVRESFVEAPVSLNHKPDEMDVVVANFAEANNDPLDTALNTNINQALQRNVYSEQTVRFSEGNIRQGFSNVLLDKKLKRGKNTQTPYTYMTKLRKEAPFQQYLNGIYAVTRYKHEETIFPRDKFSALSGTRKREHYRYPAWYGDELTVSYSSSMNQRATTQGVGPLFPLSSSFQFAEKLYVNREKYASNSQRFKNWKGHPNPSGSGEYQNRARNCFGNVRNHQFSHTASFTAAREAVGKVGVEMITLGFDLSGDPSGLGQRHSGSVWPLDSFMYSEYCIRASGDFPFYPRMSMTGAAYAHTYPAGELMSVPWDPIMNTGSEDSSRLVRHGHHLTHVTSSRHAAANKVETSDYHRFTMPKYVYSVATSKRLTVNATISADEEGHGVVTGSNVGGVNHIVFSVGGPTTRPPWTAYIQRYDAVERSVEKTEDPSFIYAPKLIESRTPFYSTYDEFKKDVTLVGKDYSILAEYKNSDHVLTRIRDKNDDKFGFEQSTFRLSGAAVSSSAQGGFISRYMLSDIFQQGEKLLVDDLDALSRPTNYSIKTNTVQKLLPHWGFYPVNRTLQIATLFSQSYVPNLEGPDSLVGASTPRPRAYQTLIDPLFAPGLLYNSIRFGVAVDHPVRGENQEKSFELSGTHADHLKGVLSASIGVLLRHTGSTSPLSGNIFEDAIRFQIMSGTKVFPARPGDLDRSAADFIPEHEEAVNRFWYKRRLPFDTLLDPTSEINNSKKLYDYHTDATFAQQVTASINTSGTAEDAPYKSAMGNFLGSVPDFFLENEGVTMVVGKPENPESITVLSGAMYTGEVVLYQTENFNIYSNPAACGPATATGSIAWDTLTAYGASRGVDIFKMIPGLATDSNAPQAWPLHRGEYAPHTAPYYYGPSIARITYIAPGVDAAGTALKPNQSRTVSLKEIIQDCNIEYLNEHSWKYDCHHSATVIIPSWGWNRAWANRMNLDATFVLDNKHAGIEPQKAWAIGTKWESPILDFPNTHYDQTATGFPGSYAFSSSIKPGSFNRVSDSSFSAFGTSEAPHTYGMWHQYGITPFEGEGVFMQLRDVSIDDTELIRTISNVLTTATGSNPDNPTGSLNLYNYTLEYRFNTAAEDFATAGLVEDNHDLESSLATGKNEVNNLVQATKINEGDRRRVKHLDGSLWKLTGFNDEDINKRFQLGKVAKRKTISEGIVAIPFIGTDGDEFEFITIPPPKAGEKEGPQVARLREKLALYNLPPALERNLSTLIPDEYPFIPAGFDFQQPRVASEKRPFAIYLFEFNMELNQQDIVDIWNNVMPRASVQTLAEETSGTVFSIDHAIPCSDFTAESVGRIDRRLRDLIDVQNPSVEGSSPGLDQRIRWMVFKVKRRSVQSYQEMIQNSLLRAGAIEEGDLQIMRGPKAYENRERNFNWPYDFFSMIEMAKVTTGVQFRPDVSEIDATGDFTVKQPEIGGGGRRIRISDEED
jgi:hypothetical protein